jgi:hypothetical protein
VTRSSVAMIGLRSEIVSRMISDTFTPFGRSTGAQIGRRVRDAAASTPRIFADSLESGEVSILANVRAVSGERWHPTPSLGVPAELAGRPMRHRLASTRCSALLPSRLRRRVTVRPSRTVSGEASTGRLPSV